MSYDVEVWSIRAAELPGALPETSRWGCENNFWVASGKSWQVVVGPSDIVVPEDIPEEVAPMLPGIGYVTRLNLEPISAPTSAQAFLKRAAKSLAKASHGVIVDPQEGSVVAPSGIKRFPGSAREETFSVLELKWWFLDGPLVTKSGVVSLIDTLELFLPEALPKRYGLYEPPQHVYEREGRSHFESFLYQHLDDLVVWYPRRPVAAVSIGARPGNGVDPRGFRASTFSLEIEASALRLPGWDSALRRVWHRLSELIVPFYGDVRTLAGRVRSGATYAFTARSEHHPVFGPWWNGVPRSLGQAVVLGGSYQDVWPEFRIHAEQSSGLWFCSAPDWRDSMGLAGTLGAPPESLVQPVAGEPPFRKQGRHYPEKWPLPGPMLSSQH